MTTNPVLESLGGTRPLDEISVGEAMHPGVIACLANAPLLDVARIMAVHRVHCVVVFVTDQEADADLAGRLWGVVSDLDLVSAAAAGDVATCTAGTTAVSPVVMVAPDDSLAHAAQLMREHEVSHLVVASPASLGPVGVLSTLDVARALV
jgi:CBS domain-containing protein